MVNELSKYKLKKIIEYFCEDITATKTAKLLKINRNTINKYFNLFREAIYLFSVEQDNPCEGVFEVDEVILGQEELEAKEEEEQQEKLPSLVY